MILLDVNILVYGFRADSQDHEWAGPWIQRLANGQRAFSVPGITASSFVRIVTQARLFEQPSRLDLALDFISSLRAAKAHVAVEPGPGNWAIFDRLCRVSRSSGKLIPDAYLAALAIEHDATLCTADRGFARFPGLRLLDPRDDAVQV